MPHVVKMHGGHPRRHLWRFGEYLMVLPEVLVAQKFVPVRACVGPSAPWLVGQNRPSEFGPVCGPQSFGVLSRCKQQAGVFVSFAGGLPQCGTVDVHVPVWISIADGCSTPYACMIALLVHVMDNRFQTHLRRRDLSIRSRADLSRDRWIQGPEC